MKDFLYQKMMKTIFLWNSDDTKYWDRSECGQTVQTLIRLMEQSDKGLPCLLFCQPFFFLMGRGLCVIACSGVGGSSALFKCVQFFRLSLGWQTCLDLEFRYQDRSKFWGIKECWYGASVIQLTNFLGPL